MNGLALWSPKKRNVAQHRHEGEGPGLASPWWYDRIHELYMGVDGVGEEGGGGEVGEGGGMGLVCKK